MTGSASHRIFISYSRKDGAEAAAGLRDDLEAKDFSVWQDLVALEGGRDWWSQIEAALKSGALHHFVLIVTPGALVSPIVRREIWLARQEGKTFLPIKGPELGELSALPRWIGHLHDLDIPEQKTTFLRILQGPSAAKRTPMMAPEPPADFIARPIEFGALKAQLLDPDTKDAVAITAALRGAGGYGKTTLAQALAHDEEIQDAYFDGVLWAELGEQGSARMLPLISDLVKLLRGESRGMATVEAARTELAEALGDRRILLIIDDIWKRADLEPFLHGGRNTTRLITTRFDNQLPDDILRHKVDAMQPREARQLLAKGLPELRVNAHAAELDALATQLHGWPQLLKLANGFLRTRETLRQPLGAAIAEAKERLARNGLPAFDMPKAMTYQDRHKSVAAAITLNLDLLDSRQRELFSLLGVFPEDADIPIGIVAGLWTDGGRIQDFGMLDLLTEFYDLSLLLNLDLDRRIIRFHDTIRRYLQDEAKRDGQLVAQHRRLVGTMISQQGNAAAADRDQAVTAETEYYYHYLPLHLAEAEDREGLDALLLDPDWLDGKLAALASPQALVADYQQYGQGETQAMIGRTLHLTAGICARDRHQLLPQLHGRLMTSADPAIQGFGARAKCLIPRPAIITQHPSLSPPGAENTRLLGHTDTISALIVSANGGLVSGARDGTIRLWDPAIGMEIAQFQAHSGGVYGLAAMPDGRLASSGSDGIKIWDPATGANRGFGPRSEGATVLAMLPDGRLAAGGWGTITLWDVPTASEVGRLEGKSGPIHALTILPDGRLASGSLAIRLWDIATGMETGRIDEHAQALAVLPDGSLASGSSPTIKIWNTATGTEIARLDGHSSGAVALAVLPDGRLASGSWDKTVRLWDISTRTEWARLEGHGDMVGALAVLPDGRLASGSWDSSIRLWDTAAGTEATPRNRRSPLVTGLALLPDGTVASGSANGSVLLWEASTGAQRAEFEPYPAEIRSVTALPGGRLAAGSETGELRVVSARTGILLDRLEGHSGSVNALVPLPDGRLASGSSDGSIRLWNLATGTETAQLEGDEGGVTPLALLPDGRLASGSNGDNIRLWDITTGRETARLQGHSRSIDALAVLPDARLASGSTDGTIQLWCTSSCSETARLEAHLRDVRTLAVLPNGWLASGSEDLSIRIWDTKTAQSITRLDLDAAVLWLIALPDGRLVASDQLGRLHWLEILR